MLVAAAAYRGIPIAAFVDSERTIEGGRQVDPGSSIPIASTVGEFRDIIRSYIPDPLLRARDGELIKAQVHARFDASAAERLAGRFPAANTAASSGGTATCANSESWLRLTGLSYPRESARSSGYWNRGPSPGSSKISASAPGTRFTTIEDDNGRSPVGYFCAEW